MLQDFNIIKKRKKLWDTFKWGYFNQIHRLYKNHSLNCGCSLCRAETFYKRKMNRDDRHKSKQQIRFNQFIEDDEIKDS